MSRPSMLPRVGILIAVFVGSLLLGGLLLPPGDISHSALAQSLPPRPTLTPEESDDDGDDDDNGDDDVEPTPAATATLAPTVSPTLTATPIPPTPIPPTPMTMPVTGSSASGGRVWVAIGIGLILSVIVSGVDRTFLFLRGKRTKPNDTSK